MAKVLCCSLYGRIRAKLIQKKEWSMAIVTFLFFIIYYLLRSHKGSQQRLIDVQQTWNYEEASLYDSKMLELGIGMVDLEKDDYLEEPTTTPAAPKPRLFDEDGSEKSLRFLIVADWGGQSEPPYVTTVQKNLAYALGEFARRYETKFVLSLGDNFCDEGVQDVDDHRFTDTFENVFNAPSLHRPWYIIAGNDDYKGNVSAEIAYTAKSKRWFFEREYYKISFQLPSYRNITVDILMIDTIELCGPIPAGKYQPVEPEDPEKAEKQWKWIERNLKLSSASYMLVAGHYPVFSGGRHGSTICLKRRLKPLLEAYHVTAYFSGHDHSAQHYRGTDTKGINYFITGATHPRDDRPEHLDGLIKSSQFFWTSSLDTKVGAFTYCDIRKDFMSIAFVNTHQKPLYYASILPRKKNKKA